MSFEIVVHQTADQDLRDALSYFRQFDQGERFLASIDALFGRLEQLPHAYPAIEAELRRALLKGFRYSVFFVIEDRRVVILGVQHQRRDPASRPKP